MRLRQLKDRTVALLDTEDILDNLDQIIALRPARIINPLLSCLMHHHPRIKWHAVTAIGHVVASISERNLEKGRIVMRRLIWMLNDESGGIGWGAPESMGEIMARCRPLAKEFCQVLFSYLVEEQGGKDNFLEYPALRQGAYWGTARLAQAWPSLVDSALPKIAAAWEMENDSHILAYCLLFLLQVRGNNVLQLKDRKLSEHHIVDVYWNHRLHQIALPLIYHAYLTQQGSIFNLFTARR